MLGYTNYVNKANYASRPSCVLMREPSNDNVEACHNSYIMLTLRPPNATMSQAMWKTQEFRTKSQLQHIKHQTNLQFT